METKCEMCNWDAEVVGEIKEYIGNLTIVNLCNNCNEDVCAEPKESYIEKQLQWWKKHYEMLLKRKMTNDEFYRMAELETTDMKTQIKGL